MYVEVISTVPDSITITMSIACHQRNRTINLIFMLCESFVFFLIIKVLFFQGHFCKEEKWEDSQKNSQV